MSAKEQLHQLVELLPDEESALAQRFLQFLVDEADGGALSEQDWEEVREGRAAIARGEFTTLEDLKRAGSVNFRLVVADPAKNKLRRLDRALQRRIVTRLDQLCVDPLSSPLSDWVEGAVAKDPRGPLADSVRGRYQQRVVEVRAIRPRGQAYRGL